ncbi:DNRLRE domain-containing protein (plasmid) [Exiguobacterium sp. Helios]|uniref:DNRLRE domain-containing protein n=1 Tax=Exiguobacterium sp. Helios TaxID=2735868 RepID=UPI00165E3C99|nr:DNRLRE domain-containing protein [Exiguobacterium sp. Helios]QNR22528.1 DNRLRE domain-containing protein [Exiguobacterium sp. Helios]
MEKKAFQKWTRSVIASSLLVSSIPVHMNNVHAEENKQQATKQDVLESSKNYSLDLEEKIGETITTPFMETEKKEEGSYELTVYNDENFLERKGTWDDVDMHLIEKEKSTIEPKNTKIDVQFDRMISSDEAFMKINDLNSKNNITFQFEGVQTKDGLQKIERRAAETINNRIIYKNVYPELDVRHIVMNEEVKEDIILNEPNEEIERFIYRIDTDLDARLDDEGNIIFKDSTNNGIEFTMPAPVMSDSSFDVNSGLSKESRDIRYELTKENDGYSLALVPNKEWLNGEDLQYPVYIDPTITNGTAQDAFVTSADPKGNYKKFWSSAQGEYVLRVGKYDNQTGTNYAFMKMDGLNDLKGATISSANLKTYVKWSYHPTTKTGIWLDKVNSSWSDSTINWDNKPASTNITSTTAAREQWATFNVKKTIQQIADGSSNDYGFKLHANGNDQNYWKQITASESAKKSNMVVSYSYPQMKGLKAEAYPTAAGSSTGYVNLSWTKATEANGYRLQLFNGKGWRTIYKGTATNFSTKNKKIWPTTVQYKDKDSLTGGVAFREGDGMELPVDPSPMYRTSSNSTTTSKAYQFRVVADYELGSSEASTVVKPVLDGIIPENPEMPQLEKIESNKADDKGWFELEWDETEGASSYDLLIFNGETYERIPVGNVTSWSSKGKRVFPTEAQQLSSNPGAFFRKNGDGRDFLTDPRSLYSSTGPKYSNSTNYFVKIIAKSEKGESLPSSALKIWFPTKDPVLHGKGFKYEGSENLGYLNTTWSSIEEAKGYVVLLHNGASKQIVARLDKDETFWSSKFRGLWPISDVSKSFEAEGMGYELLKSPEKLYDLTKNSSLDTSLYYVTVQSFRAEDATKDLTDPSRYLGPSDSESEESTSAIEISEKENTVVETNTSYKKLLAPKVEVVVSENNEVDEESEDVMVSTPLTSDLHVSWEPVEDVIKYQVLFYNGHESTYFDVPGNQTSWTTENKKIFPTDEQLSNGELSFRTNDDGKILPRSPGPLYKKVNSSLGVNQDLDSGYQISITAVHQDGSREPSQKTSVKIPLEEPEVWIEDELVNDDGTLAIELGWNKAKDTTTEILVYNGKSYDVYDVGDATTWKSEQVKIYSDTNLIVRTKSAQGEASETVVELNQEDSDFEDENVDGNRTIEDDFDVSAEDDSWELGKPKEVATKQRAAAVRAIIQIIKQQKKVKIKIKKKSNKKVSKTIKPSKANYKNKKPANDAAEDYMKGKKRVKIRGVYTTRPIEMTSERLGHILHRHDVRYWDGSLGPGNRQTFFPNKTSTKEIIDLVKKNIRENHEDINELILTRHMEFKGYTKFIDGNFYRIGIKFNGNKNPELKQFYPVNQFWRF